MACSICPQVPSPRLALREAQRIWGALSRAPRSAPLPRPKSRGAGEGRHRQGLSDQGQLQAASWVPQRRGPAPTPPSAPCSRRSLCQPCAHGRTRPGPPGAHPHGRAHWPNARSRVQAARKEGTDGYGPTDGRTAWAGGRGAPPGEPGAGRRGAKPRTQKDTKERRGEDDGRGQPRLRGQAGYSGE